MMTGSGSKTPTALLGMLSLGGLGVIAAWFSASPERFWANWILWFLFFFTLALGCLFLVALEHLVGAKWSVPIRRLPERLATLLLPVVPLALIALGAVPEVIERTLAAHAVERVESLAQLRAVDAWARERARAEVVRSEAG